MAIQENSPTTDDFAWLMDADGKAHLDQAVKELDGGRQTPTPAMVDRLRRELSPERTHLIFQQVALRFRASRKFSRAAEMFFTPVLLEQSTSEAISKYKASIYTEGPIADLCCGVGGDALGLVSRGLDVMGVDRDDVATLLTQWNCHVYERAGQDEHGEHGDESSLAQVAIADVGRCAVDEFAAWHMDPDRRPEGRRTTQVESHQPGVAVIELLLEKNPNALMKLAPATEVPDSWLECCEREWIGEQRECKQQLIRHGALTAHPGMHRATIVGPDGTVIGRVTGKPDLPIEFVQQTGEYFYEPHAAIRASGLVAAHALEHNLQRMGLETHYVTGGRVEDMGTLSRFRVVDDLAFDRKRVKQRIRELKWGPLEIKTRGAGIAPAVEQKKLSTGAAGEPGCVFLFAVEGKMRAVLAQRC